jgi:lysophospholipase L1-like esterase
MSNLCLPDGATVLFIGDSITDCGRSGAAPPFGDGYVSLFIDLVTARYPERSYQFINRGIGGNTVLDLRNRWQEDVIRHQPDWLSVKIGINDLHRYLAGEEAFSPERYREDYQVILDEAMQQTPARLILIDPFYLSVDGDGDPFRRHVLDLLPCYLEVVADLADQYQALHVYTHAMFARQLQYRPSSTFCPEPVHPNRTGHLLIAMELLRVLEAEE